MIYRRLNIGSWDCHFFFAVKDYEEEDIIDLLYDLDAPDWVIVEVSRKIRRSELNEGFTYANGQAHEALVVIGPTSSGEEYIDTLVHEVHHLAVAIASSVGVDLESETPAYIAGDSARALAKIICRLGCDHCRSDG